MPLPGQINDSEPGILLPESVIGPFWYWCHYFSFKECRDPSSARSFVPFQRYKPPTPKHFSSNVLEFWEQIIYTCGEKYSYLLEMTVRNLWRSCLKGKNPTFGPNPAAIYPCKSWNQLRLFQLELQDIWKETCSTPKHIFLPGNNSKASELDLESLLEKWLNNSSKGFPSFIFYGLGYFSQHPASHGILTWLLFWKFGSFTAFCIQRNTLL